MTSFKTNTKDHQYKYFANTDIIGRRRVLGEEGRCMEEDSSDLKGGSF